MTSSLNRRGAAQTTLPWTIAKEITLCTPWCNAMDTYVTRDRQFSKGFWEEVYANFKKDIGGTIRGYDAIINENGSSDLVLFQNALAEFQRSTDNLHNGGVLENFEKSSSLVKS
nr:hypothetical protein [Tanacetum cinerariifolium]